MRLNTNSDEQRSIATYTIPDRKTVNNFTIDLPREEVIKRALEFHSIGNISKAKLYYQICIDKEYYDKKVLYNFGILCINEGELNKAKQNFRRLTQFHPNEPKGFSILGAILKDLGINRESEKILKNAISLNPEDANNYLNLAGVQENLGKLIDAEESARKAIEIDPLSSLGYTNLGSVLCKLKRIQEAKSATLKAIQLNPNLAIAYANLSKIKHDLGNLKEALEAAKKSIKMNPNLPSAYHVAGSILLDIGSENNEIISYWQKAIKLDPQNKHYKVKLAQLLYNKKDFELALKYLHSFDDNHSKTLKLECIFSMNKEKEFINYFKKISGQKICNPRINGIIEHANIIYNQNINSGFCNNSMKYISIDKVDSDILSDETCSQLINYVRENETKISRGQKLLESGTQTGGNLFSLNDPFIKDMERCLELKINDYQNKFKESREGIFMNWPEKYMLKSWMIKMKSGGFLYTHNHPNGWISGSLYLQIPEDNRENNEGNIEFTYKGPSYPDSKKDFKFTSKKVETRDLCIFPSSIWHHTIPFHDEKERICFVFDLVPVN